MMTVRLLTLLGVLPFSAAAFPIQTVEAEEGDNVFFQCQVDNQVDVSDSPVTWSKDDRRNIVHVYIRGRDRADDQKEMFRNRTLLFHEGLRKGNVTLQLSSVRLSDKGTYTCYIRRQLTYCSTVLKVVKKGQLIRSQGNFYNLTTSPLDVVPKMENPDGENRTVCDIKYTVISIFIGVLGALILMILGTFWICKKVQTRREKKEAERTNNAEMQTLRADGREGGEHPTNTAENGSGSIQEDV